MKVIIAGGRDFKNYQLLEQKCNKILSQINVTEIVTGKQITIKDGEKYGADYLGEVYAKSKGYDIKPFPANWDKYGNGAGPIRNKQMAEYADALIVFWNGLSSGSFNMIKHATDFGQ